MDPSRSPYGVDQFDWDVMGSASAFHDTAIVEVK
jgi:hypothetical protein